MTTWFCQIGKIFPLICVLLDMWGSHSEVRLYSVLCTWNTLLSKTVEWKPVWGQGKKTEATLCTKSNAEEKDDHKAREKHQRKFSKIFNARRETIGALVFNIPILHTQCQRELCHCTLPDLLRLDTPWLCLGRRRCWGSCTRNEPVLPTLTDH